MLERNIVPVVVKFSVAAASRHSTTVMDVPQARCQHRRVHNGAGVQ